MQGQKKGRPDQTGRVSKKVGCGIFGCIFGFFGFLFGTIYLTTSSNYCARMFGEETYPIQGDPSRFDPFASIAHIRSKVGEKAILLEVRASFVRSDGTLDLKAKYRPAPDANYDFRTPVAEEPKDAPPVGAGRKPGDIWVQNVSVRVYEPGQHRSVSRISGSTRSSYSYVNEGMDIDRNSPQMGSLSDGLPDPKLTLKEMWDFAISKGADKDAVSRISYDDDGYEFFITGLNFHLYWDIDGKLMEDRSRWPGKDEEDRKKARDREDES